MENFQVISETYFSAPHPLFFVSHPCNLLPVWLIVSSFNLSCQHTLLLFRRVLLHVFCDLNTNNLSLPGFYISFAILALRMICFRQNVRIVSLHYHQMVNGRKGSHMSHSHCWGRKLANVSGCIHWKYMSWHLKYNIGGKFLPYMLLTFFQSLSTTRGQSWTPDHWHMWPKHTSHTHKKYIWYIHI